MRRPKIEKTEWKIGVQRVTEPPKLLNFQATSQSLRLERSSKWKYEKEILIFHISKIMCFFLMVNCVSRKFIIL